MKAYKCIFMCVFVCVCAVRTRNVCAYLVISVLSVKSHRINAIKQVDIT